MLYSVFNWDKRVYDVFEAPGEQLGERPKSHVKGGGIKSDGRQPETLLPVVPSNAKPKGSSKFAKGRIAVFGPSSSLGEDAKVDSPLVHSPWLTLGVTVGVVYVGFKILHVAADYMADTIWPR